MVQPKIPQVRLQIILTKLTTWYIFSEMELVSAFFQPTLQEMFHETRLKMRVMDVEQHHDYLRNIKVLILKVVEDCRGLKESHTECHDDDPRGNPNENNCRVHSDNPSRSDDVFHRLWQIYQSCER